MARLDRLLAFKNTSRAQHLARCRRSPPRDCLTRVWIWQGEHMSCKPVEGQIFIYNAPDVSVFVPRLSRRATRGWAGILGPASQPSLRHAQRRQNNKAAAQMDSQPEHTFDRAIRSVSAPSWVPNSSPRRDNEVPSPALQIIVSSPPSSAQDIFQQDSEQEKQAGQALDGDVIAQLLHKPPPEYDPYARWHPLAYAGAAGLYVYFCF